MSREHLPQIDSVEALPSGLLAVVWTGGRRAEIDLASLPGDPRASLSAVDARVDDWGHHLAWPDGEEVGADALWLASLTAWGEEDTRAFLEWRLRHALTATRAAEALGVRRAEVVAWSSGGRSVPRSIMLACRGWESLLRAA